MAHIGRFYELHFRRDYSIDVGNNDRGYARRYDTGCAFLTGTIGGPLTSIRVRCNPVDEKSFQGLKWESGFFPAGGHLVKYKIETSQATDFPRNSARITIIEITLGTLLAVNFVRIPRLNLGLIEGKEIYTSATNPPLLDTVGPNVLFQMFSVGWPP